MQPTQVSEKAFTQFMKEMEPVLRHALVATLGQERGQEATAESMAYAWRRWDRVQDLDHPLAYLYRVGRSRTRLRRPLRPAFLQVPDGGLPHVEPGLPAGLRRLSEKQRIAVVLVHAYGYSRTEVAELMGTSVSTLDSHLARGLDKLRAELGVENDV